jgi:hypothetical protein
VREENIGSQVQRAVNDCGRVKDKFDRIVTLSRWLGLRPAPDFLLSLGYVPPGFSDSRLL